MKRLCAIALLISSAVVAGHEEGVRWGIGGRAGIAAFTGKFCNNLNIQQGQDETLGTNLFDETTTLYTGYTSFQGGAFLELGYRSCNWSFGALVDVNGDTLSKRLVTVNYVTNPDTDNYLDTESICFKAPLHIGGDVRAGRYFGDALWYGLIGVEGIRMHYSAFASLASATEDNDNPVIVGSDYCGRNNCGFNSCNDNGCAVATTTACNTNCNDSKSCYFWRPALRVGTGIEYNVNDCFNIKLEYRFLWAGKKNLCPVVGDLANADEAGYFQATSRSTVYFRQHVTALMLSYQF